MIFSQILIKIIIKNNFCFVKFLKIIQGEWLLEYSIYLKKIKE